MRSRHAGGPVSKRALGKYRMYHTPRSVRGVSDRAGPTPLPLLHRLPIPRWAVLGSQVDGNRRRAQAGAGGGGM